MLQVAKACKAKGAPHVETYSVDLADLEALDKFAKSFLSSHQHCDVLVNNAGMMAQGSPTEGVAALCSLVSTASSSLVYPTTVCFETQAVQLTMPPF